MNILVGAHSLNFIPRQYRHRVGNLFSPGGYWNHSLDFALDNAVYAAWKNDLEWSELKFLNHLDKVKLSGKTPRWIVCPDVVGDCLATRKQWDRWSNRLRSTYGWHLAYAVQDGQMVEDVPSDADLVFVGGTTEWKHQTIEQWCQNFPTHVGVNTYRWLWWCHKCGAKSIDGTGWFWRNKKEHQHLLDYLAITEGDRLCETGALFPIHEYLTIN
ncbi:hypothetical protein [Chamaesiphon sp.]|uniref:hypothetical protein n=1 Tax=Chamaesiphon sp. TaxID=2814140 RepID=UPI0035945A14